MNFKILLLASFAAALGSCSTAYKSGQTPDDVYYSPARSIEEDNDPDKDQDKDIARNDPEDRQIRMKAYDRRWRDLDDDYDCNCSCKYDPYHYGYNYGYYYNPYYYPSPVYIPGTKFIDPKNSTPRMTNLGSYNYTNMSVVNPKTGSTKWVKSERAYNNSNNSGSFIRRVITPQSGSSSSPNNTRTYSPSSNSSSSSSSGSKPVSRPSRH